MRIFKDITRENVGKRMAIMLFERARAKVVTAPVIRSEIGGGRVQISGRMTTAEANDTALLLRGRLAGRAHGNHRGIHHRPEPGRRQHRTRLPQRGLGHGGHCVFMCIYYMLFGIFSSVWRWR